MNEGQRAHIIERLHAGATEAELVQYLQSEGIDDASAQAAVREVMAAHTTHNAPATTTTLPAIGDLLRESWDFTKSRLDLVGWYVLISLAPLVFFAVPALLGVLLAEVAPALVMVSVLLGVVALVGLIWFMVVASGGLFYAVAQQETTDFRTGWRWAKPRFWQIAVLGALLMLVLMTGMILLIVPALIVLAYTIFYFLEFMRHDHRGFHALAASTHIISGQFWAVTGRMLAILVLILVVTLSFTFVYEALGQALNSGAIVVVGDIIGMVISFVLTILMMRYLVLLYSTAAARRDPYQPVPLSPAYRVYRAMAWLGGAIFVVAIVGTMFALLGFAA